VAALVALLQLDFARAGRTSPLTAIVTTVSAYLQLGVTYGVNAARGGFDAAVRSPGLAAENARLRAANAGCCVRTTSCKSGSRAPRRRRI
jgi:hypothetical protein